MRLLAAIVAALLCGAAHADDADAPLRFYGYVYELDSGRYLYTEVHEQRIEGERWLGGAINYFAANGTQIGRKTLDFAEDEFIPRYRLDMSDGYFEAITAAGPRVEMERRASTGKPVKKAGFTKPAPACADSGFHSFVRAHFQELLRGETLHFRLVVSGSLDQFKFRIQRIGEASFEGKPVVRFKVTPDSLLRFIADPMELWYEPEAMKLVEYRGISNIHDPASGRTYDVRIAYFSTPPADAPQPLPPLR